MSPTGSQCADPIAATAGLNRLTILHCYVDFDMIASLFASPALEPYREATRHKCSSRSQNDRSRSGHRDQHNGCDQQCHENQRIQDRPSGSPASGAVVRSHQSPFVGARCQPGHAVRSE